MSAGEKPSYPFHSPATAVLCVSPTNKITLSPPRPPSSCELLEPGPQTDQLLSNPSMLEKENDKTTLQEQPSKRLKFASEKNIPKELLLRTPTSPQNGL